MRESKVQDIFVPIAINLSENGKAVISETAYTMKVLNMLWKETKVHKCKFSSILKEKRENLVP